MNSMVTAPKYKVGDSAFVVKETDLVRGDQVVGRIGLGTPVKVRAVSVLRTYAQGPFEVKYEVGIQGVSSTIICWLEPSQLSSRIIDVL